MAFGLEWLAVSRTWGLGFRVWGLGFGVSGLGFRVSLLFLYQRLFGVLHVFAVFVWYIGAYGLLKQELNI